jgi:hypothetical protein
MSPGAKTYALLAAIAVSTPLALAVETGMRILLFPPEFEELRMLLRPVLTGWMWTTPLLAALATLLGIKLQRWTVQRHLAKLPPDGRTPVAVKRAEFDTLMLSTSVPQVPALVATFGFTMGSALLPVVVAIVVATAGVLLLGFASGSGNPDQGRIT